jgi:hypothetical protein
MIIHDFDFYGVGSCPNETYAVSIIDPNAMLPRSITVQGLQAIAAKFEQIVQIGSRTQDCKFDLSFFVQFSR